jgi:type IX secretion system PorP/SprF family membrane protein
MSIMKKITFCLLLISCAFSSLAQDPLFSQYYQAPLFLNPGFTGLTAKQRFVINHRIQWPGLPQSFSTYAASYDAYLPAISSGVGIIFTSDKMGSMNWHTNTAHVLYSYKIRLNEELIFSPGISFGFGSNGLDRSRLKMGDVLQYGGTTLDPTVHKLQSSEYMDFGSGFLLYSKNIWMGANFSHLNRPHLSFLGENDRLAMKTTVHAGIKFDLTSKGYASREVYFAPSFIYRMQGKTFSQLDAGINFHIDPVSIGAWYRGKPFSKDATNAMVQDALILVAGLNFKKITAGYSYDFTISSLGPGTGGAHEISLIYQLPPKKSHNKNKLIPCPAFYGNARTNSAR